MPNPDTAKSRIALLVILLVAVILRLAWLGVAEFKLDEATVARAALAFIHEGVWPTLGQTTSLGFPNPPLSVYLQALPYAISRNPAVAVGFLGLLGVLAVAFAYFLGKRIFDSHTGLITAALFATSPWVIFYSRKLWTQNLPAATLAFMLALYVFVVERKRRSLALLLPALALLVGLYAGDMVYLLVLIAALVCHPRVWQIVNWRWLIIGLGGAILVSLPFLIGLSAMLPQPLPAEGSFRFWSLDSDIHISWPAFFYPLQIGTGYRFHALAGDRFLEYRSRLPPLFFIGIIEVVVLGLGVLYVTVRAFVASVEMRPRYVLLALWIWIPTIFWSILGGDHVYPHHFILLYPAQHLAAGVMLSGAVGRLSESLRVWAWRVLAVGISLVMAWNVVVYVEMVRFVDSYAIDAGYGEPVHYAWDAGQRARRLAQVDGLPIVVLTDGFDPRYDDGAAVFDVVLGDMWLYLLPGDNADMIPANGGIRVSHEGFGDYQVSILSPPENSEAPLGHLANGIDLLDVSVENAPQPGRVLSVTTNWRIWGIPPTDENYSLSVQLYDDEGARWGQGDMRFMPTDRWYPGDYYTWDVALPVATHAPSDADYALLVVMYTYPDLRGVSLLDELGNLAGEHVLIPLEAGIGGH